MPILTDLWIKQAEVVNKAGQLVANKDVFNSNILQKANAFSDKYGKYVDIAAAAAITGGIGAGAATGTLTSGGALGSIKNALKKTTPLSGNASGQNLAEKLKASADAQGGTYTTASGATFGVDEKADKGKTNILPIAVAAALFLL